MRTLKRRLGTAALTLTLSASVLVAGEGLLGSPAFAAGCNGMNSSTSCKGKDPLTTGCSADAVLGGATVMSNGAYLEHWWSPACNASWGRITNAGGGYWVCVHASNEQTECKWDENDDLDWSAMVDNRANIDTAFAYGVDSHGTYYYTISY